MKRGVRIIFGTVLLAAGAAATEFPRYEVYAGYDWVRFNPNSDFIPSFNANGGSGQFVYNFNKWIGAAFDAGAVTKGVLNGFSVDTTVANFVAGPRFMWHGESRWRPFAEVLFGGAYATTSTQILLLPAAVPGALPPGLVIPPGLPVSARLGASNTGFAMLAGGGLDIKLSKHIAFRPVEADYYLTRVSSLVTGNTTNRNNFRYSGGITFMFGGAK